MVPELSYGLVAPTGSTVAGGGASRAGVLYYRRCGHCSSRGSPSGALKHQVCGGPINRRSWSGRVQSLPARGERQVEASFTPPLPGPGQPDPKRWASTLFMLQEGALVSRVCASCTVRVSLHYMELHVCTVASILYTGTSARHRSSFMIY